MNVLEDAICFAAIAHDGQKRKMSGIPYILHPLEVVEILASIDPTNLELMAAGVLHDTVEDCDVDPRTIKEKFGPRVAALVQSESEDKLSDRPASETWMQRKEESLIMLRLTKDLDVKKLWLGDKLSNMRSFWQSYQEMGDNMYSYLHQRDPKMHYWYYHSIAEAIPELADTAAYKEYVELIEKVFGGQNNDSNK